MAEYIDREEAKTWIANWLRVDKNWHPYSKGKNILTAEVFDMLNGGWVFEDHITVVARTITHWMPLPEPPEEGET